jgi:hypothetical protein
MRKNLKSLKESCTANWMSLNAKSLLSEVIAIRLVETCNQANQREAEYASLSMRCRP